jgi:ribose transport system substrate-binding protein
VALSLAVTVTFAVSADKSKADAKKYTVAMVPPALVSPYFIEAADAAKKAAAKYGNLEFTVLAPADETKVDEQVKILEDLIQKKVNLILISSGNWEAVAPVLQKAIQGGISVAIFNQLSDVPVLEKIGLVSAVGVDEVEGGKVAGQWVAKVLNGKGKIAILEGVAGDYWTVREGKGIDSVLATNPNIKIVARQPANWERAKGMEVAENILQANKELDLICAMNDNMALGASQAVENGGRRKQIKIIGYNGNVEALKAIAAGKMDATVNKQPSNVGKTLIEGIAVKLMKGEKKEIKPITRITPVIITAENVKNFLK